jgi:serine/threonine transporter
MNIFSRCVKTYIDTPLILRVVTGLVIGTTLALALPGMATVGMLGDIFVRSLKAIAPVLVFLLVCVSLAGSGEGIMKRFRTVIILYIVSMLIAGVVSVAASMMFPVSLVFPGSGQAAASDAPTDLGALLRNIVSEITVNPVSAVAGAHYLSILFWAIVIGLALKSAASEKTIAVVQDFADSVSTVTGWIIQFAPFGVLGLSYTAVSTSGIEIFKTYGLLVALLVGCMLFKQFVCSPLLMSAVLGHNAFPLMWKCVKESGVNAFFTRSSAANIPVNMDLCRRLGLDKSFYSVSIPLGSTVNMDGATITITVMVLATCHTLGIDVTFGNAIVLCILATVGACGASGIPGGSLLLIPMACSLFNIPPEISMQVVGVGFIIGVVQDSFETALNSCGDVMFTATADLLDRKRKGQPLDIKAICSRQG